MTGAITPMRVCVYGAGAIGGHLAARLCANGHDVTVIARGAQLAAIQQGGLTVTLPASVLRATPRAVATADEAGPQDAVIVTAKSPAIPAIAAGLAPLLGPQTPVAFVMNGIPWWYPHDPEGIAAHLSPARAIGGVVYSACTVTAPGHITVAHDRNMLVLGEPDGALTPRLAALAAALRCEGLRVDETDAIRDWVWTKLLNNLATGPLSVLTRTAPAAYTAEPGLFDLSLAMAREGAAIAAACGCTPRMDIFAQLEAGRDMTHRPSILQDLEAGRPMEIATLMEAPLALGRARGVQAPLLEMLVAMVRLVAKA